MKSIVAMIITWDIILIKNSHSPKNGSVVHWRIIPKSERLSKKTRVKKQSFQENFEILRTILYQGDYRSIYQQARKGFIIINI